MSDTPEADKMKSDRPKSAADYLRTGVETLTLRGKQYDKEGGERSAATAAKMYTALTGKPMSVCEGWLFLGCVKMARLVSAPGPHDDSALDMAVYAALAGEAKWTHPDTAQKLKKVCADLRDAGDRIQATGEAVAAAAGESGGKTGSTRQFVSSDSAIPPPPMTVGAFAIPRPGRQEFVYYKRDGRWMVCYTEAGKPNNLIERECDKDQSNGPFPDVEIRPDQCWVKTIAGRWHLRDMVPVLRPGCSTAGEAKAGPRKSPGEDGGTAEAGRPPQPRTVNVRFVYSPGADRDAGHAISFDGAEVPAGESVTFRDDQKRPLLTVNVLAPRGLPDGGERVTGDTGADGPEEADPLTAAGRAAESWAALAFDSPDRREAGKAFLRVALELDPRMTEFDLFIQRCSSMEAVFRAAGIDTGGSR